MKKEKITNFLLPILVLIYGSVFLAGILRLLVQNEQFVDNFRKALGL